MRIVVLLLIVATVGALGLAPARAASAPHLAIASLGELAVPEAPYDTSLNADAAVDDALARARRNGKRVLIDLGGNWCPDCRILAGIMELPQVDGFLRAHYEMVCVDVGRFDRNLQIPARFGITDRLEGVPSVLIVDADGRLINAGHTAALADARHMTPQALADWLAEWAP
jgi:thiol-disulfide isomerase/thioredoxin